MRTTSGHRFVSQGKQPQTAVERAPCVLLQLSGTLPHPTPAWEGHESPLLGSENALVHSALKLEQ